MVNTTKRRERDFDKIIYQFILQLPFYLEAMTNNNVYHTTKLTMRIYLT